MCPALPVASSVRVRMSRENMNLSRVARQETCNSLGTPLEVARLLVSSLEGAMLVARSFEDVSRFQSISDRLLTDLSPADPRPAPSASGCESRLPVSHLGKTVFPCHALHDKLQLKGASQPGAVMCLSSMIGGIAMNDDSSSSRRNLLLGVGGAGLLAAGLAASSPRTAAAQGTDALTTQDIRASFTRVDRRDGSHSGRRSRGHQRR